MHKKVYMLLPQKVSRTKRQQTRHSVLVSNIMINTIYLNSKYAVPRECLKWFLNRVINWCSTFCVRQKPGYNRCFPGSVIKGAVMPADADSESRLHGPKNTLLIELGEQGPRHVETLGAFDLGTRGDGVPPGDWRRTGTRGNSG